jgi:phospholipase/lecithinase/hemolysin
LRRAWLLAACAPVLLLAACGGGSTVSQLTPSRIIAFGDAMADIGQDGARWTINDGSLNNWTLVVASDYGRPLVPSAQGGLSFATGNARVTLKPDAVGNAGTPTVTEQISTFLASNTPGADDLILVNAGTSDVIVQAKAVLDGAISEGQALANVDQAGRELGAQVRRLVSAGAHHVIVMGTYNLGRSPWAAQTGQSGLLQRLSSGPSSTGVNQPRSFNESLLISMVDLGADVLYVDAALQFNLITGNPSSASFNLSDASTTGCTSVDPGPGIGTGAGQVNSHLCTANTLQAGVDPTRFLFADRIYPTPRGHQLLGDFAFGRIRDRF